MPGLSCWENFNIFGQIPYFQNFITTKHQISTKKTHPSGFFVNSEEFIKVQTVINNDELVCSLNKIWELKLQLLSHRTEVSNLLTQLRIYFILSHRFQSTNIGTIVEINLWLNHLEIVNFCQEGFFLNKSYTELVLIMLLTILLWLVLILLTLFLINFIIVLFLSLSFLSFLLPFSWHKSFLFLPQLLLWQELVNFEFLFRVYGW